MFVVAISISIAPVGRTPMRFTSCCAIAAPRPIPTVTGRNARPASSGE
jgi:hypothetical protein